MKTAAGQISYSLARSSKRRTLAICIDPSRQVRALAPLNISERSIENFIHQKAFWIVQKIRELECRFPFNPPHDYQDGEKFLFLGEMCTLRHVPSEGKRIRFTLQGRDLEAALPIDISVDDVKPKIKDALIRWYRKAARETVSKRLPPLASKLGVRMDRVTVRTQQRIWGSCYYKKNSININWKVVMAPEQVIDYILCHEMCHLDVPDHSRRFWEKVRSAMPSYEDCEQWLKDHESLMRLS